MTNNSSYNLSYNVCIKPRGYGKSYKIMEESRKVQWLTNDNEKNKLKKS